MHLVRHHKDYCKIVKSVRKKGKVKSISVKYVGRLTFPEETRLRHLLKGAAEADLDIIIQQARDSSLKLVPTADPKSHLQLVAVRENVYRKSIDKDWLTRVYLEEHWTVGHIAQVLGISKDRVREHLDQLGLTAAQRVKIAKQRMENTHLEFGWHLVEGRRLKDPTEYKLIEKMIRWRREDLTFQNIADKLTEMGVVGKGGVAKWDRGSVRRIIVRNEKLAPKDAGKRS